MVWDLNDINRYFMQNLPDPAGAFDQGRDEALKDRVLRTKIAQAQQDRDIALARQQRKSELIRGAKDPADYLRIIAEFPEDAEAFKTVYQGLDETQRNSELREMTAVRGYLAAKQPEAARKLIQNRIDADRAAGRDTADDEEMLAAIDADADGAASLIDYSLVGLVGPDRAGALLKQVGDDRRADQLQPSAVRTAEAGASKAEVEAAFAPTVAATGIVNAQSQIDERNKRVALDTERLALDWDKLGLDKDALKTNTALKIEELTQAGNKIEGTSLETLNKAVGSAVTNQALAERTKDLAARLSASDVRGHGFGSDIGEFFAAATGNQDAVSALRGEYARIKNGIAIQNLPPGAASDSDVKLAMKGFPPDTADKAYLVKWLSGVSKLQEYAAANDQSKADWISSNGNIGTARRDLDVGGVRVPKGTTFGEFMKNRSQMRARNTPPPAIDNIIQKYRGYKAQR